MWPNSGHLLIKSGIHIFLDFPFHLFCLFFVVSVIYLLAHQI